VTCERCKLREAVPVRLTIPIPPGTLDPKAPREVVGELNVCPQCYQAAYGKRAGV